MKILLTLAVVIAAACDDTDQSSDAGADGARAAAVASGDAAWCCTQGHREHCPGDGSGAGSGCFCQGGGTTCTLRDYSPCIIRGAEATPEVACRANPPSACCLWQLDYLEGSQSGEPNYCTCGTAMCEGVAFGLGVEVESCPPPGFDR